MPKRTDIHSILLIGAGPIIIGQACEFDYSGTQACKALRAEGYKVILVNSNPATIMTDTALADVTYIEPITRSVLEKIIEKERPDALLPTMGGQTALNAALDLAHHGILARYQVELIGASEEAIKKAEDRGLFKAAMANIGLACPQSSIAHTLEDALAAQAQLGFPTLIRPSFTLGGSGGGIAYNRAEFLAICERGLETSPTHELLIEQSVLGWKEYEMEVVRDNNDNCIIVCAIENIDPMGIHTGDSITVAPTQTLRDKDYQRLREAAIAVVREIGVATGGANVQFAIHPKNDQFIVIEMNPRVSRSSALASKATGFPIAKVAAKLAVGYTLDELKNELTDGVSPIAFEPTLDYVVTKIPRFAFEKFPDADDRLTTQMKSVGEVMAIGRTFQESLQKALRGLEVELTGLNPRSTDINEIRHELAAAGAERILYLADALRCGMSVAEIYEETYIDPWFITQIADLVAEEQALATTNLATLSADHLLHLKKKGFSDQRLAELLATDEHTLRKQRWEYGLRPVYKRVDTCAAEFASSTAYLYSTYEEECEAQTTDKKKMMVLGSGPNRIGQGIEFDYCCVQAAYSLAAAGFETIMVNCNPETVSTDYDTAHRLYFEPLTLEDVLEIAHIEQPDGVMVQLGGQTPLKLARALEKYGLPIVGTAPDKIDAAEDRERFAALLTQHQLKQPEHRLAKTATEALNAAAELGYPLIVRPSYVLGGRAMEIIETKEELERYIREAVRVSNESPVLLDRFLKNAIEVDVDCVADGQEVIIAGLMEHVEQAGIHSGDSACSLPPYSLPEALQQTIREHTVLLARALDVVGLMNVQFAIQEGSLYVLEVNPRASRTVPFVSKAIGMPLAYIAARAMVGISFKQQGVTPPATPLYFSVKEAVFPFIKFPGVDTLLGPEMRSTGEVMGIGKSFAEAFIKSQLAAGDYFPSSGRVLLSVRDSDKPAIISLASAFVQLGWTVCATRGTALYLTAAGLSVERVNKVNEGRPHIVDRIKNGEIALIINTVEEQRQALKDSHVIRSAALHAHIPLHTTLAGGEAVSIGLTQIEHYNVYSLQELQTRNKH